MFWRADNTNSLSCFYCQSDSYPVPLGLPSAPTHGSVLRDSLSLRGEIMIPLLDAGEKNRS